jgi:hypothetical protein
MAERSSEAVLLQDLLRRSLSHVLAEPWPEDASGADLRAALRDACDRARNDGLRAEQLLLALKEVWRQLPERGRPLHIDSDAILARLVTACIDEYYDSYPTKPELSHGQLLRSEARQGRSDTQNAELH